MCYSVVKNKNGSLLVFEHMLYLFFELYALHLFLSLCQAAHELGVLHDVDQYLIDIVVFLHGLQQQLFAFLPVAVQEDLEDGFEDVVSCVQSTQRLVFFVLEGQVKIVDEFLEVQLGLLAVVAFGFEEELNGEGEDCPPYEDEYKVDGVQRYLATVATLQSFVGLPDDTHDTIHVILQVFVGLVPANGLEEGFEGLQLEAHHSLAGLGQEKGLELANRGVHVLDLRVKGREGRIVCSDGIAFEDLVEISQAVFA